MDIDVQQIKSSTSLQGIVADDLGPPRQTKQAYATWLCPLHADHDPSLVVYSDPLRGWWCYGCEAGGDVFDWLEARHRMTFKESLDYLGQDVLRLTPEQMSALALERERQAAEHRLIAQAKRREAAKLLSEAEELEAWADELERSSSALRFLSAKGITEAVALHFGLGFKPDFYLGPAITIPWRDSKDRILNVQYRNTQATCPEERYRWDERGTKARLFNPQAVTETSGPLLVVEGAFKTMVLVQHGLNAVGVVNKGGWDDEWAPHFRGRPVYVALDPDAKTEAHHVASTIGHNARAVQLPAKPDDLITQYGWGAGLIQHYCQYGRVVD